MTTKTTVYVIRRWTEGIPGFAVRNGFFETREDALAAIRVIPPSLYSHDVVECEAEEESP